MRRKKIICSLVLSGVIIMLVGCMGIGGGVRGTGPMTSRDFEVEDFNALNIGGAYDVIWQQSDSVSVTVEMQENLFDFLRVSVRQDTLHVDSTRSFHTSSENTPRVYIFTPYLEMVSFSGAVNAENWDTIEGESFTINGSGAANISISLEVETLDIELSGAGDFTLSGNAHTVNIIASGAAEVSADDLQTSNTNIELSGAGHIDIAVSDHLSVDISGAGHVRYTGNPTIDQSISGAGRLEQR